jgi:ankyrin repeat protein
MDLLLSLDNNKHEDQVASLVMSGKLTVDYKQYLTLKYLVKWNMLSVIIHLFNSGIDPSILNNHAIRYACKYGHIELLNYLLTIKTVDPTARGSQALEFAIENNDENIISILTKDGRAKFEDIQHKHYIISLTKNLDKLVQHMIRYTKHIPRYAVRPILMWAVRENHLNILKEIENHKIPNDQYTELVDDAIIYDNIEVLKYLFDNINCDQYINGNLIEKVIQNKNEKMIALIIERNKINPIDKYRVEKILENENITLDLNSCSYKT